MNRARHLVRRGTGLAFCLSAGLIFLVSGCAKEKASPGANGGTYYTGPVRKPAPKSPD